ncbi:MAG: dihydrofolate reductase [Pelagimonas sp.]|jgi:dihydrofolate reductase|nr:dihydrofolate reductase [Pelagimonas sp.]
MITLIAAHARNHAIGKDNDIPWFAPEDLAMFKRETLGGALIMGRKTWESLPVKPLKSRLNVVVSRNPDLAEHVCGSVEDAISLCRAQGYHRIYGIGGQSIYAALMPHAQRMLITEVDLDIAQADAFFPEFEQSQWDTLQETPLRAADPKCDLVEYLRRTPATGG